MKVRCSSLPRFFTCASSALPAESPVNIGSDEADLGTAAHECLARMVLGLTYDVDACAKRHGVGADELGALVSYGARAWSQLAKHFPAPKVEEQIESDTTPGTADVAHADGETLVVLDWKSGRSRRNYQHQLAGYARLAVERYGAPASGRVQTIVVWLRYLEFEVVEWTVDELAQWQADFEEQAKLVGKEFAPGEDCGFCQRRNECAAYAQFVVASSAALVQAQPAFLTPAELAALYAKSRTVKKAIEAYEDALRSVVQAGGDLPIDDERVITLVEAKRDEIDARTAWPVLESEGLTPDDINSVLTVKKGALEEIISDRAPRGAKGARKAEVMGRLRSAGAVLTSTFQKLETRKVGFSK